MCILLYYWANKMMMMMQEAVHAKRRSGVKSRGVITKSGYVTEESVMSSDDWVCEWS